MSAQPVSFDDHPPHGHPDNQGPSTQKSDKASTASHPPATKPDPTTGAPHSKIHPQSTTFPGNQNVSQGGVTSASSSGSSQLANLEVRIKKAMRQFPDWPQRGVLFEDIMPIFASPNLHNDLITALERQVKQSFTTTPDVIVALEARGFLFGPSLALRLNAGFVAVRKKGKLPGDCLTEEYQKEYGTDYFQVQKDSIKPGQKVLVVDDLMATGGSAAAAGSLAKKCGGELLGCLFLIELGFLNGRQKLDAPVVTLLKGQDEGNDLPLGKTVESADEVKSVQDAGGAAAETRP